MIAELPLFSSLVDRLPEPMTCGCRSDGYPMRADLAELPDYWQRFKSNGDRVCSHCGSLHPDDFFALVKVSAEAAEDADYRGVVEIEQSDKGYKIYVHQPGVRNAHEGGIKFYVQHLPRVDESGFRKIVVSDEQRAQFSEAILRSKRRFEKMLRK